MVWVEHRAVCVPPIFADAVIAPSARPGRPSRDWTWINWVLSLLVTAGAAVVMAFALTRVSGMGLCSSAVGPGRGANGSLFNVLYDGAGVVAVATLFFALFGATQRWGLVVWLVGWAALFADFAVLIIVF